MDQTGGVEKEMVQMEKKMKEWLFQYMGWREIFCSNPQVLTICYFYLVLISANAGCCFFLNHFLCEKTQHWLAQWRLINKPKPLATKNRNHAAAFFFF